MSVILQRLFFSHYAFRHYWENQQKYDIIISEPQELTFKPQLNARMHGDLAAYKTISSSKHGKLQSNHLYQPKSCLQMPNSHIPK